MKRILLTGATGVMGMEGLKHLVEFPYRYEITVLARDSKKNRKKLAPFIAKGVKAVWGDLLDKEAVKEGVGNADIVLHVGGMVSPEADRYPEQTIRVNVGGMRNIIEASLPRKNEISVVYIGSVSQYGPRYVPDHWGQCGDPLLPAYRDAYAFSKVTAERLLLESDIRKCVSLRQTGILHSGLLKKANDPIAFHVPIKGVLEWVTAEDSGRLLEKVCSDDVPDSFWGKTYNIGGGAPYRLTNYEFESMILKASGCPSPEKIFDTGWFATRNFHGMWYTDSDDLEQILHFRSGRSLSDYLKIMKSELPWYFSLAPLAPAFLIKAFMRKVAMTPELGTLWWLKTDSKALIDIAWGSREEHDSIPGWSETDLTRPSDVNPGVHGKCEQEAEDCDCTVRSVCPECGTEYSLRIRTKSAGHGCPECLRRRLRMELPADIIKIIS
ncbi:MAG: NAD-dependent epimerase/dehydratase family protein [Muribaculaceae bacterium]|nr:NAD-dependent epimerase/dehydratase family protein [Muribaculaceae bacterium]